MLQRPNLKISLLERCISEAFIQTSILRHNMFDNELPDPVWQLEQLLQVLPHPPQHNGALDTDHMQQCALHVPRCSLQQVIGRVMGKSFHSIFWSSKPSLSRQQRDRENKKASITHFYKCQYFLELSKGFCISAETLYHVSQSFPGEHCPDRATLLGVSAGLPSCHCHNGTPSFPKWTRH